MPHTEVKTVKLTINGKPCEAALGTPLIDAAEKAGIFVPRYCYHQDLSIAGVCRMCVVEIEKNPRLQIACNTAVAEGMVVMTDTVRVKEAVKSALELHLINHPLDCPICDKAGECKLQDFYQQFGLYKSRMEYNAKGHKPKVVDIGTIVLDEERCILCTRCVRFTAEVTKTHELGIFNRGDRSELRTYDGKPLRNDYTGNLADICPVGALTAKDFRFQQRVWFLEKTKSICTLCSRGCNTTVSYNPATKKLYRVEPRRNPEVNRSWMCDVGRWGYHYAADETRIRTPRHRTEAGSVELPWDRAFQATHEILAKSPKRVLVGISTQMTNEEIADLAGSLKEMGVEHFTWLVDEKVVGEKEAYDGILKHRDQTGNAAGFQHVMRALGISWVKNANALGLLGAGVDTVILAGLEGHSLAGVAGFVAAIPKTIRLIVHASTEVPFWEKAEWVLPNVTAYEKSGTMINALGRLQRLQAALPAQYTARDGHALAFGLARGNDREAVGRKRGEQIFEAVVASKIAKEATLNWKRMNEGVALQEG